MIDVFNQEVLWDVIQFHEKLVWLAGRLYPWVYDQQRHGYKQRLGRWVYNIDPSIQNLVQTKFYFKTTPFILFLLKKS